MPSSSFSQYADWQTFDVKIEKSHVCPSIVWFELECKMKVLTSYCLRKRITVYNCLSFITIHKSVINDAICCQFICTECLKWDVEGAVSVS
jgi:hypothetical protein